MAAELAALPLAPLSVCASAPPVSATELPQDLAGTRFLHSAGLALLATVWGAWLGAMVEAAVEASAESRLGATTGATALVVCGMLLAFYGTVKHGMKEALGRSLMDGIGLAWQGA